METSNFIVYKSSAGSGKTFTLVKEYLKLALKDKSNLNKSYKGILAITFTNKAASEMKLRIIKALKEISSNKNEFLCDLIAKDLSISNDELKQRASILLTHILHHYSDFSIGTIDSFTHRIIRTFALDLQLPFNFQIETDTDSVFSKVISTLINNLGKDELITNYLLQFSLAQVEDNKSWDPESLLFDFIRQINKESDVNVTEQFANFNITDFDAIKTKLHHFIKEYKVHLQQQGAEGLDIITKATITKDTLAGGGTVYNFFKFLHTNERTTIAELYISTITKMLDIGVWHSGKATENDKDLIYSVKPQLENIINTVYTYLESNEKKYTVYNLIYKNIYAMGLVNELAKLTTEYKLDENVLFLSEFNERISKVVANEPTPFIFERLGDKYKHFLLDEFQDTSALQWQNLLPLVDNSLASGNLNLIVGDGKQSIYRWRNANVEQFVNLPNIENKEANELLYEREASLKRNFSEAFLDTNFRSEPTIVKFNNELFEFLSNQLLNEDLKRIYFNQEQKHKLGDTGYVSIEFPEIKEDTTTDAVNTICVLKHITQALVDGYDYNDICVIIRDNYNGNKIANFLVEQNIPVVSRESLLLANAKEVKVLVAFLKFILNHKDLVSASLVLNYLYMNNWFNQEKYVELLKQTNLNKQNSFIKLLQSNGVKINELKITTTNLYECCVEIANALKLNENNPQYIRFFLDEVLSFLQTNTSNISTFLTWWDKRSKKASVIIPEGMNAVNIMTIHASKGLEFPIVISPYVNFKTDKSNPIWVNLDAEKDDLNLPIALLDINKDMATTEYGEFAEKELMLVTLDNLNVLYVNFTRAVNRLHIISPKPQKSIDKSCYGWLHSFATTKVNFNTETNTIEFGSLSPKKTPEHASAKLQQLKIDTLDFNINNPIKIKSASALKSTDEQLNAREYGILVHNILSQIHSVDDIDTVIEQSIFKGEITDSEAILIKNDLINLLSNEKIAHYFSPNVIVKNELEILTELGAILRPDRVVVNGTEAIVIDYKTGKKEKSKHHHQMQEYQQALLQLGYKQVKNVLIYIQEKEIEMFN